MSAHGDSLPAKLARFWHEHPFEWLTLEDIAVKFSASPSSVKQAIRDARHMGARIQCKSVYFAEEPPK